ncbi:uncharacterized protein [Rutidosis leptorrhynchoides]|uniref:uncharacterized protein n=1 Tax=Rutidosis leptorrhynchoides TaxID=125765 RepID=UPI003A99B3A6
MNSRQPIICKPPSFYQRICLPFYVGVIFVITATISCTSSNETDLQALLSFKSMISDPYGGLTSWNESFDLCDWSGVTCGERHRRVTTIILESQGLQGSLSPHVGNLTFLREFSLYNNSLQGSIPNEITHLYRLLRLDIGHNGFSGVIPTNLSGFYNVIQLWLDHNKLVGSIPKEIGFLPKLALVAVDANKLTGGVPSFLGNQGEADDMKFIDSLKNCSMLMTLDVSTCSLQGVLPRSIGNLSDQLSLLYLGENQLHGNIPSSVGNLVGLVGLNLEANRFSGIISDTIGMLQKVQQIILYENNISGPIPDVIANLSLLNRLDLYSNRLEGLIPSNLGNCHSLLELRLYDNKLCGKIPVSVFQLPSLSKTLDLSQNQLFGSIPIQVGYLELLDHMDLSYNNLSGNIPDGIGGCTGLTFISFRGNVLQGSIPPSLTSLKGLVVLDISQNNLSGQITQFSQQLSLKFINLSFNDFEGEVPIRGVFANTREFSVVGNTRLCGGLTGLGLHKCKKKRRHEKKLILIVILCSSTILVILCVVYVWCKTRSNGQPSQSSMNERFLQVSYNQLLNATNGFSESNLIGKGGFSSVYKGILNIVGNEIFVAVKVLSLQNRRALRSFTRECDAWRNIRHRNLLKIITSCSSVDFQDNDFKALVYEFMPNGSLNDWLHSSAHTSRLSLIQRLNILMDIAYALDYLHNRCQTTIVHGDIKPSNILLDEDMVAHVGDFGLARILGADSNQNSSTGIKGTIGYAPPEYGLGSEMTSNGDVYSYGILLLHVMTGKKPTDDVFNDGSSLHEFAYMALQDGHEIVDIIDNDVIELQSNEANTQKLEECLASIIKIGVSCSVHSPSQRINMEYVVNELRHIKDSLQNI